jgi:CRP-like cAMP-binding protein
MSLEADMRLLAKVPLFATLDDGQLRLLAFGAEQRRLAAGAELYKQGGYSDGGYVIAEGRAQLVDGEKVIGTYGTGTLLGELALITATDHSTSAVFPDGGMVLKIPRPLFRRMLEEYPALAGTLSAVISRKMGSFIQQLDAISKRLDRNS